MPSDSLSSSGEPMVSEFDDSVLVWPLGSSSPEEPEDEEDDEDDLDEELEEDVLYFFDFFLGL
jgi:hypothetical protein